MEAVLGLLGLEDKDVSNSDTLEGLGVDSMQLAEIRARLQRALCRPVPIEEVRACSGHPTRRWLAPKAHVICSPHKQTCLSTAQPVGQAC